MHLKPSLVVNIPKIFLKGFELMRSLKSYYRHLGHLRKGVNLFSFHFKRDNKRFYFLDFLFLLNPKKKKKEKKTIVAKPKNTKWFYLLFPFSLKPKKERRFYFSLTFSYSKKFHKKFISYFLDRNVKKFHFIICFPIFFLNTKTPKIF